VGATPKCGSTVTIVVSSGPEPCTVPPVVGLTESAARAEIQKADLAVGSVTEDPEAGAMNGTVVSSDPAATSEVDCGSSVDLVVTPITVG
jgi:serine/threonine-protein kinase